MAKKSKLLAALDAHKGRDYEAEKRKKHVKAAEKRKRQKAQDLKTDVQGDLEQQATLERPESEGQTVDTEKTSVGADDFADFSEAEDEVSVDEIAAETDDTTTQIPQPANGDASASEADPDSDVPLSDLSEEERADTIPHQRLTINNSAALLASRKRIQIIKPTMRFSAHNSLVSKLQPISTAVPDANDDLTRELEFYRVCRDAATEARRLFKKEDVPFTRPSDYFAEMVKSDEHMGLIRKKLYEEAASKKAAGESRALRDAKKFGKAVQVAKEQERAREKRQTLERIGSLKRKRKGQDTGQVNEADDLFESVDVEEAGNKDRQGRERDGGGAGSKFKRQKKDERFGFGGKKRFAKSGDAASTADMRGFSAKRMKGGKTGGGGGGGGAGGGGPKRLGKSRRAAGRS